MLKKSNLKRGKLIYLRDGEFYGNPPGEAHTLVKEVDKPISYIPDCREVHDQDLNCDVYMHQLWDLRKDEKTFRMRLTAKLGKWFGVYKRYFSIVNFEIKEDEDADKF